MPVASFPIHLTLTFNLNFDKTYMVANPTAASSLATSGHPSHAGTIPAQRPPATDANTTKRSASGSSSFPISETWPSRRASSPSR